MLDMMGDVVKCLTAALARLAFAGVDDDNS